MSIFDRFRKAPLERLIEILTNSDYIRHRIGESEAQSAYRKVSANGIASLLIH